MNRSAVIVTGGSRGIGLAIVEKFVAQGRQVVACGRGVRPRHIDASVEWVQADVSKADDANYIIDCAMQRFGGIGVLVNNAGVQIEKTVIETTDADWDEVVGINARGTFNLCRAVLPSMVQFGGSIINLGSISGHTADPAMAIYNASKAFVHGFTRSIAVDHGPYVRCNAVCPGWVMTAMADDAFAMAENPAKAKADALARHPAGRFGQPEDIAEAVVWLASDAAQFITGQCFVVDGGLTSASPLQPRFF